MAGIKMAEATQGGQSATRRLFGSPAKSGGDKTEWMEDSLEMLATALGVDLAPSSLKVYVAVLDVLTWEEALTAFVRAAETCRFLPRPAELLAYAGKRQAGDPLQREADEALADVLGLMRHYGPELKPRGDQFVDRGPDGELLEVAYRTPIEPCPAFPVVTEAALIVLGLGDRAAGLRRVAVALELPSDRAWANVEARKLVESWFEAYARAKDDWPGARNTEAK